MVRGVAVFPDHAGAADHRRERSLELQPDDAVLVGLDQQTAIVREASGQWNVIGPGHATIYRSGIAVQDLTDGQSADLHEAVTTK